VVSYLLSRGVRFEVRYSRAMLLFHGVTMFLNFGAYNTLFLRSFARELFDADIPPFADEEILPEDYLFDFYNESEMASADCTDNSSDFWICRGAGIPKHKASSVWSKPIEPGYWKLVLEGDVDTLALEWKRALSAWGFVYRLRRNRLYFSNAQTVCTGLPPNAGLLRMRDSFKITPEYGVMADSVLFELIRWKSMVDPADPSVTKLELALSSGDHQLGDEAIREMTGVRTGCNLMKWLEKQASEKA